MSDEEWKEWEETIDKLCDLILEQRIRLVRMFAPKADKEGEKE